MEQEHRTEYWVPYFFFHAHYLALGVTDELRQAAYQTQFGHQMDEASLKAIRESVNSGTTLGSERFKEEIEATLARSVRLGTPEHPRKKEADDVTRQCDLSLMRK